MKTRLIVSAKAYALLGIFLSLLFGFTGIAQACSLAPISLYDQYSKKDKVFIGIVKERLRDAAEGQGTYRLAVREAFKGMTGKGKAVGEIEATIGENAQCGLGKPEKESKILVFMNDGDVILTSSGSRLVWDEMTQPKAFLNPVMDQIVTLRRMIGAAAAFPTVPDAATAHHQALKVLLAVFGQATVDKNMPFQIKFLDDKESADERVWFVEGTFRCEHRPKGHCVGGVLSAKVNKWTGDVVSVSSGD